MNIHELESHKHRELLWIQNKIVESINKSPSTTHKFKIILIVGAIIYILAVLFQEITLLTNPNSGQIILTVIVIAIISMWISYQYDESALNQNLITSYIYLLILTHNHNIYLPMPSAYYSKLVRKRITSIFDRNGYLPIAPVDLKDMITVVSSSEVPQDQLLDSDIISDQYICLHLSERMATALLYLIYKKETGIDRLPANKEVGYVELREANSEEVLKIYQEAVNTFGYKIKDVRTTSKTRTLILEKE